MRIKRFKLREGVNLEVLKKQEWLEPGGTWMQKDSVLCGFKYMAGDITLNIAFPDDLSKWDDFNYVELIDENFGQPYTPFYGDNYGKDITNFAFLEKIIKIYNEYMSSFDFLEEVRSDGQDRT